MDCKVFWIPGKPMAEEIPTGGFAIRSKGLCGSASGSVVANGIKCSSAFQKGKSGLSTGRHVMDSDLSNTGDVK